MAMKKMAMAMKSGKKRPMNKYFELMQKARKANAPSFEYNGKTYVQKKAKTGMILYAAKK